MTFPAHAKNFSIRVLVAEDDIALRQSLTTLLGNEGYDVVGVEDGNRALKRCAQERFDLVLSDLKMPGLDGMELLQEIKKLDSSIEIILLTAFATVDLAVEAMKFGAGDFVTKPFKKAILLAAVRRALEKQVLLKENASLKKQLENSRSSRRLVASSPAMRSVMELVEQVAPTSSTVLIMGESGTGKEVIADEIHRRSLRADRPFIKVSCAALPETLLESELFGHEKGAFTGALTAHAGRFELADGGTLFLDEIGEVPSHIQVKLLRVLQDGQFERVGGTQTLSADVRIIAATNRDLKKAIEERFFREDLYYRLNVIPIVVPPLRERPEEIPLLAHHFLEIYQARNGRADLHFSDGFLASLIRYPWPGNTRELENTIERAVIMSHTAEISEAALSEPIASSAHGFSFLTFPLGSTLEEMEERAIENALEHAAGDKERAAKLLGITPRTIYRFLERQRKLALTDCQKNAGENTSF